MEITKVLFGKTSTGQDVYRYSLRNRNNVKVDVINYGASLVSIEVPDKTGKTDDVITGYDTLAEYESNPPYFGSTVGRVSGRIHNGRFVLDGQEFELAHNNGSNSIHGGLVGFNKKVWSAEADGRQLRLQCTSPDGEEGYPGELSVQLTYELTDENELVMDYTATTTKPTPVSLTNHAYFNLAGHKYSDTYDHSMMINADTYTPKNTQDMYGLPNGEIASVEGTIYDMRKPVLLGTLRDKCLDDANYCLPGGSKTFAARVEHKPSGRALEVYTDQPALQMYTAWALVANTPGKDGTLYQTSGSFCLEAQHYPDAVNKPSFPSCILRPGQTYRQTTSFKFTTVQ